MSATSSSSFRRLFSLLVLGICSLASPLTAEAAEPPDVVLSKLIKEAAARGDAKVVIPAGTYRLENPLRVRDVKDLEIDGIGVELVMTRYCEALLLEKCRNLKVKGFTVDYDPLPFTQGTVEEVSPDQKTIRFTLHEGYPSLRPDLERAPRHVFDPITRRWKNGANLFAQGKFKPAADNRSGEATFEEPQRFMAPDDLIVFDFRHLKGGAPGVMIREGGPVTVEDVWLRAAPGLAICVRTCTDRTVLRRVRIAPGPRPEGATQDRLLSTDADGANLAECRRGPLIEDCDFSYMGDDSMNVHGRLFPIVRVESPTSLLVVRPSRMEDSAYKIIRPGDTVRLMEAGSFIETGKSKFAKAELCSTIEGVTAAEVGKLYPQSPINSNPALPFVVYRVTLSEPLKAEAGQWFDIPAINCPDYEVKNSYFHDHRARGLRLMGDDGVVQGNRFERLGSSAIQVGPEIRYWREAGWVDNLVVKDNTLRDIGFGGDLLMRGTYTPGAISVCGRTDTPPKEPYAGNQNIVIEGNDIDGCPVSGIHAYAVKGLVVRKNKLSHMNLADSKEAGRENSLSADRPIEVSGALNPVVEDNSIRP